MNAVIPGRALRANPESITPVFAFSIHTLAQGVWIPGLRIQVGCSRLGL
jgi:hypothetical protein